MGTFVAHLGKRKSMPRSSLALVVAGTSTAAMALSTTAAAAILARLASAPLPGSDDQSHLAGAGCSERTRLSYRERHKRRPDSFAPDTSSCRHTSLHHRTIPIRDTRTRHIRSPRDIPRPNNDKGSGHTEDVANPSRR